jgi:hypothetical protein
MAGLGDTTKILYIGNSFTYFNELPDMVDSLAHRNNQLVWHYMHAPGGISVGDTGKAAAAHMDNPLVYQLIRSSDWDFVVVQDNQGRFILDSAVFPNKSRVVAGHLMLMDSVKHYHPCAKMIWFAGWGLKNGQLPNWPTGVSMIDKLLVNYRVLNATADEIIAPIGEAWKKSISQHTFDLWTSDEMHPSTEGSYLAALVLYSTMLHGSALNNGYMAGLVTQDALSLQNLVHNLLITPSIIQRYNLNGVLLLTLLANGPLHAPSDFTHYQWYLAGNKIAYATDSVYHPTVSGTYWVTVEDASGCILKSCYTKVAVPTGISGTQKQDVTVFPNPFHSTLQITSDEQKTIEIKNLSGLTLLVVHALQGKTTLDTSELLPGVYLLLVTTETGHRIFKLIKQPY